MVIYRFPQESGGADGASGEGSSQQSEAKAPDFIYIDEERRTGDGSFSTKSMFTSQVSEKKSYPLLMRIATLVIAAALTVWTMLLCVVFVLAAFFAAILLFRPSVAMRLTTRVWQGICCMSAYALAFYVATLSPVFGFAILGLYTMQHGKDVQSGVFGRFFKQ